MYANNNMMGREFQSVVNGQFIPQRPRIERVNLPTYRISKIEDVQPGDVSMTGDLNLFITSDLQRIYAKVFTDDGTISTGVYVLQTNNQPVNQNATSANVPQNVEVASAPAPMEILQQILARIDDIEGRMSKQSKPNYNKQNYRNKHQKKGESDNGKQQ